ncbi:MAG: hypothetical protein WCL02_05160 [bacterium]
MEILHTKNTNKENHTTEVIGIHANSIVQKNIAKPREVNMRMDALCMDQEIAKSVFGEEIYNKIKDTLKVTKPTLNTKESKNIETLPEFQEFLKNYTLEKNRVQTYTQQEKNLHDKKDILENMDMPEEIVKIKNSIQITKAVIRETIDEKQEKIEGNRKTYTDILKKS